MNYFIFFIILVISFNACAELYKPKIEVKEFIKKVEEKNQDYLFTNESGDKESGFKQVFFRDRSLDSKYNPLFIGVSEYRISYREDKNFYAYGETFLDCRNNKKIRVEQVYDEDGYYLESQAYSFSFDAEHIPVSKMVCANNSN